MKRTLKKPISIIVALLVCGLLIIGICILTTGSTDVIWIDNSMRDSYLFEINNSSIKVTVGDVYLDTESAEISSHENSITKKYRIPFKNRKKISDLLSKIGKKRGTKHIHPGNDSTEVFAFINGKLYWTSYYRIKGDKDLLELTKLLVEITDLDLKSSNIRLGIW